METDASTVRGPGADSLAAPPTDPGAVPALVVAWARGAPGRAGEVFLLDRPGPLTVGRGTRITATDPRHLRPVRQRPGDNQPQPPLRSPRLSRSQLTLRLRGGILTVENRGQLDLIVSGRAARRAQLRDGDVLELGQELVLLVAARPLRLPGGLPLQPFGQPDEDGIVGEGPAAWTLRRALRRCAGRAGAPVLLRGASGTGKELAAAAVHRLSGRRGPLVARSAATFPEGLIDAELFGNIRSYPNPGMPARPGLVGEARGGTLFLDEIGELPEALQARLLRLLDHGEYHRLGDATARQTDLRFIGATNRPAGTLKPDLLARLTQRITLPGLGARRADLALLLTHRLRAAAGSPGVSRFLRDDGSARIAPGLIAALLRHRFTTHVRELDRLLWLAIDHSPGRYLDGRAALPLEPIDQPPLGSASPGELQRADVVAALAACGYVQAQAWKRLGLSSRHQLGRLMKKLGIPPEPD